MDLHLRDLMTPAPLTAAPTDTLATAADAMRRRDVSSAVILRDAAVVGILTERDLTRAAAAGAAPATTAVAAWMTPDPVTLAPESEITAALERMLERNVRHLPVCAAGALVGTVSLRQLVRAASLRRVDPWAPGTARGLENVTVAETRISHIDATGGRLIYVGHDAVQLARTRAFEDVWHLLLTGALPAGRRVRAPGRDAARPAARRIDVACARRRRGRDDVEARRARWRRRAPRGDSCPGTSATPRSSRTKRSASPRRPVAGRGALAARARPRSRRAGSGARSRRELPVDAAGPAAHARRR